MEQSQGGLERLCLTPIFSSIFSCNTHFHIGDPQMDFKDYYKILGVEPTADEKAIKAAYRKLARKYHPDVSKERDAEDKFKEANEAYEVLGDAQKRAEFDEIRKYGGQHGRPFQAPPGWENRGGGGGFEGGDFSDFFSSIFGNRGGNPFGGGRQQQRSAGRRGQDVELELAVFLEETLSKESKQISFQVPQTNAMGQRTGFTTKTLNVKIPAGVTDGGLVGGLDDHRALGHDQGLAVDLDGHMPFRHDRRGATRIVGLRAHAAAASTFLPSTIE